MDAKQKRAQRIAETVSRYYGLSIGEFHELFNALCRMFQRRKSAD